MKNQRIRLRLSAPRLNDEPGAALAADGLKVGPIHPAVEAQLAVQE